MSIHSQLRRSQRIALVLATAAVASAVRADGLMAWGFNNNGQLGNGTTTNSTLPVWTSNLAGGVNAFTAGEFHSLAVKNGAAYAWGSNYRGELATGDTNPGSTPVAIDTLSSGVTALAGGEYDSLAVKNGAVFAWGYNASGQLGNGTTTNSSTPVAVTGLSNGVTDIAAGTYHNLAIRNGALFAWGYNDSGRLGNGTTTNSTTPVAIAGFSSGVADIAAGESHSLAIKNGAVYAWGSNSRGKLGLGTTASNVTTPTPITSLSSGCIDIAAGEDHSLALKGGSVYAWGWNAQGQLGYGSQFDTVNVPQQVDPAHLKKIVAVAASYGSSYALDADGTLWVWGFNNFGQLGLSSTQTFYFTPQHLLPPTGYAFRSIKAAPTGYHTLATVGALGDANDDDTIDTADFALLAANFSGSGKNWSQGDFNGDGLVNALDFNSLASNFGRALSPAITIGTGVPEPACFIVCASVAISFHRRTRPGSMRSARPA